MLTQQEKENFFQNGFVGPFKLYEKDEAKTLLKEIRKKNADQSNALFPNYVNYDRHFDIPELAQYICHPKIVSTLNVLLGKNILCWRTEFFPKFPGSQGTQWHQVENYQYATGVPQLESIQKQMDFIDLTVWTAFTDSTIENGCLKLLPGSHKKKYYDESKPITRGREAGYRSVIADTGFYGYEFSEFKIDPSWSPDEKQVVNLEMKAGEFLIFTAKCVHGSNPNITERSTRFAISARYVPPYVKVYPNQERFIAHGAEFDLKDYGCVLVSGINEPEINKIRKKDNYGDAFI